MNPAILWISPTVSDGVFLPSGTFRVLPPLSETALCDALRHKVLNFLFARCMIRCPFSLEKMRYNQESGMVIYRSKLHATLKRIPDKYEHLVRYCGYYSNRSRGARRSAERTSDAVPGIVIDDVPVDTRRKANWARLTQKVDEVDPLKCMRIIALIEDASVIERILKRRAVSDPPPETIGCAGPDPPVPNG